MKMEGTIHANRYSVAMVRSQDVPVPLSAQKIKSRQENSLEQSRFACAEIPNEQGHRDFGPFMVRRASFGLFVDDLKESTRRMGC
jgi:hypothetical protein